MTTSANLTSLPIEVLSLVSSQLDKTSLIELSRVSRAFTSLAEDRIIWHHLSLQLPPFHSLRPTPHPEFFDADSDEINDWIKAELESISTGRDLALREKVKNIILRADLRRWSMVREVTMRLRSGAVIPVMLLLDYVSPYIRRLSVESGGPHPFRHPSLPERYERYQFRHDTYDFPLTFSALTHMRLSPFSSDNDALCSLLVRSAPNLTSLEIDFQCAGLPPRDEADVDYEPHFSSTKIRHFRCKWDRIDDHDAYEIFRNILKISPAVQQLNIGIQEDRDLTTLVSQMAEYEHLRDLRWSFDIIEGDDFPGIPEFDTLQRLVLCGQTWRHLLSEKTATMDALEILYLDTSSSIPLEHRSWQDYPDPFPSNGSIDYVARDLRHYPKLHTIEALPQTLDLDGLDLFDWLDEHESPVRRNISSMRHEDDDELIMVTFTREMEIIAEAISGEELCNYETPDFVILPFERWTKNGTKILHNVFKRSHQATMYTLTDYDELAVPIEIIQAMRDAEGGDVDWNRRGVVVGGSAWAILIEWHRGVLAALDAAQDGT